LTCWEIAVAVFAELRGRGIGSAAHALLVDYLFKRNARWSDVDDGV